jgi:hypothetical protein
MGLAIALTCGKEHASANWPGWRGPGGDGAAPNGEKVEFPTSWTESENILWKTTLPGKGCSTPIVWNHSIYLTAPSNGENSVLSIGQAGNVLWTTRLGAEEAGKHQNGSGSNPSPTTDGRTLFVYFKSGTLAALSLTGTVQWQTNLVARYGKRTLYWDYGTSPVLTKNDVVVATMQEGGSWITAFDKASGQIHWQVPRNYQTPSENDHSYASPLVVRENGVEALLVWGAEHLSAHDAADGHEIWSCGGFNPGAKANWVAVSSPIVVNQIAMVPFGRGAFLHGIGLGGHGDVTEKARRWLREGTGTFVPTPAAYQGKAYLVRDRGEVECINPNDGQSEWRGAFPKDKSSYYASPAIADGVIYAPREDGVVFAARITPRFEILSTNTLNERVIASPALAEGRIYLRGEKTLFCVGKK